MIYFASANPNKLKEFKEIIKEFDLQLISKDISKELEEVEKGTTFLENAFLKAKKAYELTKENVLADDSGLEIEALHGFPGIYSARFASNLSYPQKNQLILDKLQSYDNRKARFCCALVLVTKEGKVYKAEGYMNGNISKEICGQNGFGYDPIFIPDGYDKSCGELEEEIKNTISHRYHAYQELKKKLPIKFLRREEL